MNRYSPFLQAVDPSRAAIPVPLTLLSSAVASSLKTEPGAKLVQQSVQRRAQAGHAPAPWHDRLLSDQQILREVSGPSHTDATLSLSRPQQIAQRHEVLRLFAARVLYANALQTCLKGVRIRKPLDPLSVWYLFCADGDIQHDSDFVSRAYFSWRGKTALEALITSAERPEEAAEELAADTVRAMVDLEESGFGEAE